MTDTLLKLYFHAGNKSETISVASTWFPKFVVQTTENGDGYIGIDVLNIEEDIMYTSYLCRFLGQAANLIDIEYQGINLLRYLARSKLDI